MQYHIALGRSMDLAKMEHEAQLGLRPRHIMWGLSQHLQATIHAPGGQTITWADKLLSKLVGQPHHWALARQLASQVGREDVIYCTGEDIGLPIATLCGAKRDRPKIVVFVHNLDRPKGRVALRLLQAAQRVDLFIVCARPQAEFLQQSLNLSDENVWLLPEQTDDQFFTPGPASSEKVRPTIVSVGLEKRDYRTLAAATADLPVQVKISGFSQDASVAARAFPETLPENMSCRFYEWPDLVQLYRDADVVVVSVEECKYGAGITNLVEAMACRRPIVVVRTTGLSSYLETPDIFTIVDPGDVVGMRQAIEGLLNQREAAAAQAERAYQFLLHHQTSETYLNRLSDRLKALATR